MTSDDKNKSFDSEDNSIDVAEIDDVVSGLGAGDDEIDMDGDEDYTFDAAEGAQKSGGGMKKMMAPVLVLAVAAAVGGYIVMNPDIIGKLTGGAPAQRHADATAFPAGDTMAAAPEELPQPAGANADLPMQPPTDMAAADVLTPEPLVAPAIEEPEVPRAPEEIADITASESPVSVPAEDVAMNGGPDAWQAPQTEAAPEVPAVSEPVAPVEAAVVTDPVEASRGAMLNAEAPAAAADVAVVSAEAEEGSSDAPVVQTVSAAEATPPAMPVPMAAPVEVPPVSTTESAAAPQPAPLPPQGTIAQVTPPATPAPDGSDMYYDAGIDLPRGPIAKETIREVDPSVEPGQKMIIAKKDYNQSSQEALLQAASRALKLQRYDAALEMYEQLYAKNKRDPRILMGLAVSQQYSGRADSAIQTYEALLDIDPRNADAMLNMLGLLRTQYPEVALRRLMDLQKRFPGNAGIPAQIGVLQADLGNYEDAVRYMQMAASLEPRNAQHLFNIAVMADRKGAKADAIKYYEQALENDAVYTGGKTLPRQQIYDRLAKLRTN